MAFDHFKAAQASRHSGFETALAELQAGRKTSHWIWYIFPQLAGLGHSGMAQTYALRDINEAVEYLRDPMLCERLERVTETVAQQLAAGVSLPHLMGSKIDALKLVSSLTLFEGAACRLAPAEAAARGKFATQCAAILDAAAAQGYARCEYTARHIGK